MIYFDSDYMAGAHPRIMRRLQETNLEATVGYGTDAYCAKARALIREACGAPDAEVHFLVGGTQTNAVAIDGLLRRHQGVLAAESGHINVHEAGAIEASGHKVLTLPSTDGKVSAHTLRSYLETFYADETWDHMVQPGMLYISQSTELGTVYTLKEMEELSQVCHKWNIYLYIDGARLGYALASHGCDFTLKDIARLSDAFYIGGTKVGALMGEALVLPKPGIIPQLFSLVKQHGALLAKGRLLGIQFQELFTDGLYQQIGEHAVSLAMRLKAAFLAKGYRQLVNSPTNQQFFVLPNTVVERLKKEASFELWGAPGKEETPVRFVTSWATTDEDIAHLEALLK